jgi:hypothetical protein
MNTDPPQKFLFSSVFICVDLWQTFFGSVRRPGWFLSRSLILPYKRESLSE